jgi:hypothetical protein
MNHIFDSDLIDELEKIEFSALNSARLDFEVVQLLFIPSEKQNFDNLMEQAMVLYQKYGSLCKDNLVCTMESYNMVFDMLVKVKKDFNIKNTTVAFNKVMEWAEVGQRLEEAKIKEGLISR